MKSSVLRDLRVITLPLNSSDQSRRIEEWLTARNSCSKDDSCWGALAIAIRVVVVVV